MKEIGKLVITTSLIAFLMMGLLLFTGHVGYEIKISNYLFFILSLGIVVSYINNDQK